MYLHPHCDLWRDYLPRRSQPIIFHFLGLLSILVKKYESAWYTYAGRGYSETLVVKGG